MGVELSPARWLRARMAAALALLLALPPAFVQSFLFVYSVAAAVGLLVLSLYARVVLGWPVEGLPVDPTFVLGWPALAAVVVVGVGGLLLLGPPWAMRAVGARAAGDTVHRSAEEAERALGRLARTANVPTPDLAVARTDVPNAFTVGRRAASATVVVTTGLLEECSARERDAVLAHELAHVRNRDASVMTATYLLPALSRAGIRLTTGLTRVVLSTAGTFLASQRRQHRRRQYAVGFWVILVLTVTLVTALLLTGATLLLATALVFWLGSALLHRTLSRAREFAADRGAVAITGDPVALASALRRLDDRMAELPDRDLRDADGGHAALYVAPLRADAFDGDAPLHWLLPDTHPSTDDRVDRLRELARELETGDGG